MSIVKQNLKMPLFLVILGLSLLFYINFGNIDLLRDLSNLVLVNFNFSTLVSIVFRALKIVIILLMIVFCLKKLDEISSVIIDSREEVYGLEDLLRRRYYYTYKTWGYFLYTLGWVGVVSSLIGNTILIFNHSNNIVLTIVVTVIITIPLEIFIAVMLNKYLVFVKKIMSVYK